MKGCALWTRCAYTLGWRCPSICYDRSVIVT